MPPAMMYAVGPLDCSPDYCCTYRTLGQNGMMVKMLEAHVS